MTRLQLVARYTLFAVVATLCNLGVQRLVLGAADAAHPPLAYAAAIGFGTLAGLLVKYVLDKRWIFRDIEAGLQAHARKFSLYTLMGVVTTLIFWCAETLFWLMWHTHTMRELGAVLGLAIGYFVKYRLDRKYVFRTRWAAP